MSITYLDSAEGIKITFRRAMKECANHGMCQMEAYELLTLLNDDKEPKEDTMYDAETLLLELGY